MCTHIFSLLFLLLALPIFFLFFLSRLQMDLICIHMEVDVYCLCYCLGQLEQLI